MKIDKGTMRFCLVTENYVIKIPRLSNFIRGWIANKSETHFFKESRNLSLDVRKFLCPVLFSFSGFVLVMPKVDTKVTIDEVEEVWKSIVEKNLFLYLVLEPITGNFGKYKNRIVVIDYNIRCF